MSIASAFRLVLTKITLRSLYRNPRFLATNYAAMYMYINVHMYIQIYAYSFTFTFVNIDIQIHIYDFNGALSIPMQSPQH